MHARTGQTPIGVAVIGAGWMGHVHARAYARLPHHYPDIGVVPRLVSAYDTAAAPLEDFARRYAPERTGADWRDVLDDPAVDAVSVTTPNALHRGIGVALARAGKHLWMEKPVGLGTDDARAVAAAVTESGIQACIGYNYRNVPAVARARALVHGGAIGTPTHARVALLTDYAAHPRGFLSWRFNRASGGSGVLGDLASHGVDLVRFLLGDLERLVADTAVFVPRRPVPAAGGSHYAVADAADGEWGDVENEDYVTALLRTRAGVRVTLEASRVSAGDQNAYGFAVHGTRGRLAWDFRRPGELAVSVGEDYTNQPTSTVLAGPGDGDYASFQPGAGIAMSYDDTKVVEAARLLRSIRTGTPYGATAQDAVRSAEALEAMQRSAAAGTWISL